jgi:hypothetical protein
MIIALDYDNTYTRDIWAWNGFIRTFRNMGHKIYCVTMRKEENEGVEVKLALEGRVDGIFFTNRRAKEKFMYEQKIAIDVWIDDCPFFVLNDANG